MQKLKGQKRGHTKIERSKKHDTKVEMPKKVDSKVQETLIQKLKVDRLTGGQKKLIQKLKGKKIDTIHKSFKTTVQKLNWNDKT